MVMMVVMEEEKEVENPQVGIQERACCLCCVCDNVSCVCTQQSRLVERH